MAKPRDVRLSHRTEKAIRSIETRFKNRLKEAIRELSNNPLLGKKLKGEFEDFRSYRVGSFRITYRFNKERLEIAYLDDRKDVYR